MTDELTPELVEATVGAKQSADIRRLLDDLHERAQLGPAVDLPPPTHEWLDGLDEVTDDLVVAFLDVLYGYDWFDPPLTPEDKRREGLEAHLRHGSHRSGFHLALLTSITPIPDQEASELLFDLGGRGTSDEQESVAAKWLVSSLLDSQATRGATVYALGWMQDRDDLRPIVDYVRPQLEPAELAELAEW